MKGWKERFCANGNQKKAGVAILVSDKMRGWKKIFHANGNQKKAGVAILR